MCVVFVRAGWGRAVFGVGKGEAVGRWGGQDWKCVVLGLVGCIELVRVGGGGKELVKIGCGE